MATKNSTRRQAALQGATIHHLPTAHIAPLPRKANCGRLPKGIARFSAYRRQRDAAAVRDAALEARRIERLHHFATLIHQRALRKGVECTFEKALDACRDALGYWGPRGAA